MQGETVLIHGASGSVNLFFYTFADCINISIFNFKQLNQQVGTASIQLAKAQGLKVVGTAGTDSGMKQVKKINCRDPI